MSAHRLRTKPAAIKSWGKRPVYRARIIHSEPAPILLKSARPLAVGLRISFATLADLNESDATSTPPPNWSKWRSGVIWRIDKGCLHLTRT